MKDKRLKYLSSMLPEGPEDKSCALHLLPCAIDFVRERDTEFGMAPLQKCLKAGYADVVKVMDAMLALCVIEIAAENPRRYKRLAQKEELE